MVNGFEFYPHTCVITRCVGVDSVTGNKTVKTVYDGRCYLTQGNTGFRENQYSTEDVLMLPDSSVVINEGDKVVLRYENGSTFEASVKQAYPIEDCEFGGQDLKLHK